ncbi:MAG: carboxypeptidase regulatory-like domain-containing protein [Candidatus Sumerlaeaceae bacterium]|nr:carboxypeptidase regulatory-like domain-containing protein [Candidatus Sumerlaeaceae bacterium]
MTGRMAIGGLLAFAAGLILVGCGQPPEPKPSKPSPTPPPAVTPATTPAPTPTPVAEPTTTTAEIRVDVTREHPMQPLRGTIKAYTIEGPKHMQPGETADGFFGDAVLENDLVRVVVSHPQSQDKQLPTGGHIIDVAQQKDRIDYIEGYRSLPDLETTAVQFAYERMEPVTVLGATTAVAVVSGFVGRVNDAEPTAPLTPIGNVAVTTTYSLQKDSDRIAVTTRITNNGTEPVDLLPGDFADWGHATSFLEGTGLFGGIAETSVTWALGFVDDFSVGIHHADGRRLEGLFAPRTSVIRMYGSGTFRFPGIEVAQPTQTTTIAPAETPKPIQMPPFVVPSIMLPDTETPYRPTGAPQPETNMQPSTGAPGGGGENKDETTSPAETETTATTSTLETSPPRTERLVLKPGESYEYTRYLVVSDRDFARIAISAYRAGGIRMGAIGGAVIEQGTGEPIADAEVRISGGPDWNGARRPPAFVKTLTREDGTYAVHLPPGNYVLRAAKRGREAVGQQSLVTVTADGPPRIVPLTLTRESIVSIAVADAAAATSEPLPCKVTIIAKPGTPPVDFGPGTNLANGVRNVMYMPYGAAHIPLTPGRYQLTISRGIEYDIIEQDVDVQPGQSQRILLSLTRAVSTPGQISVDAGVMTTASAVSNARPEDRVIQAACEGVSVLVTGDYDTATDLQPQVAALGLGKWVRTFPGMRMLVRQGDLAAEVLAYPLTADQAASMSEFRRNNAAASPDVFLADLKKAFPGVLIEICAPLDPQRGYFAKIPFNENQLKYDAGTVMPPPDFDAIQILEGQKVPEYAAMSFRFYEILRQRMGPAGGAAALTATGGSGSRLTFSEEVGYPRMYINTVRDTPERVTPEDIVSAVRGQHVMVSSGPILKFWVEDPATGRFTKNPGDVVDLATTDTLRTKINILAANWIDPSGIDVRFNGRSYRKISMRPVQGTVRYPVREGPDADIQTHIINTDGVVDCSTFTNRRTLRPVVASDLPEYGGDTAPVAWVGGVFIDKDGDGRVVLPEP